MLATWLFHLQPGPGTSAQGQADAHPGQLCSLSQWHLGKSLAQPTEAAQRAQAWICPQVTITACHSLHWGDNCVCGVLKPCSALPTETLPDPQGSQDSHLLPSTTSCANSCLILPSLKVSSHQSLPVPPGLPGKSGPCHALTSWDAQGSLSMRDLVLATSPLLPLPGQKGFQTTAWGWSKTLSLLLQAGLFGLVCPPTPTTRRLSGELRDSWFKSCPSKGQGSLVRFSSHQPPS